MCLHAARLILLKAALLINIIIIIIILPGKWVSLLFLGAESVSLWVCLLVRLCHVLATK